MALAIAAAGCAPAPTDDTAARKAQAAEEAVILKLDADWMKTAVNKDADGWVAFYADSAVVLPPNEKLLTGKPAMRRAIGDFLGQPGLSLTWQPTKVEVSKSGDLAYLYGAYSSTSKNEKGDPVTDVGKLVEVWKKQPDGSWKCIVDTWNSDVPLPAPAPVAPAANPAQPPAAK
jgi:ketosteroid isomerase-like protein